MRRALAVLVLLVACGPFLSGTGQAAGPLLGVSPGEHLVPGSERTLDFGPHDAPEGAEMEILLSVDGGRSFPLRLSSELPVSPRTVPIRIPNTPTTEARLALRIGRDGDHETVVAMSAPFVIPADPAAPLETFRARRSDLATQAAADSRLALPIQAEAFSHPTVSAFSEEDGDVDSDPQMPDRSESEPTGSVSACLGGPQPPAPPAPLANVPVFLPKRE